MRPAITGLKTQWVQVISRTEPRPRWEVMEPKG